MEKSAHGAGLPYCWAGYWKLQTNGGPEWRPQSDPRRWLRKDVNKGLACVPSRAEVTPGMHQGGACTVDLSAAVL